METANLYREMVVNPMGWMLTGLAITAVAALALVVFVEERRHDYLMAELNRLAKKLRASDTLEAIDGVRREIADLSKIEGWTRRHAKVAAHLVTYANRKTLDPHAHHQAQS